MTECISGLPETTRPASQLWIRMPDFFRNHCHIQFLQNCYNILAPLYGRLKRLSKKQAIIKQYSALITQATLCSGCVLSCGRLRGFAKSYQFIIFGIAFRNRLRISEGAFHIGNSSMCYVLLYCILHKLRSDLHRQRSTIV